MRGRGDPRLVVCVLMLMGMGHWHYGFSGTADTGLCFLEGGILITTLLMDRLILCCVGGNGELLCWVVWNTLTL